MSLCMSNRSRKRFFSTNASAVQYKHLGLQGFAEHYVRGFLRGGSYEEIPLEKQANELETRSAEDRDTGFSVEADVRLRMRLTRF